MTLGAPGARATSERGKVRKARRRCKAYGRGRVKRALLAGFAESGVGMVVEVKGPDGAKIFLTCDELDLAADECGAVATVIQASTVESYVDSLMRRIEANR